MKSSDEEKIFKEGLVLSILSAVAKDHVDLQELLVLEAHVAEDARDRLRLHLGQLWSVFELEHGVQGVLLVDLVNLLLEMATTKSTGE
jgi:hypothetical protein